MMWLVNRVLGAVDVWEAVDMGAVDVGEDTGRNTGPTGSRRTAVRAKPGRKRV